MTSPPTKPNKNPSPDLDLSLRRALLLFVAAAALTGVLAGLGRIGLLVAWGPTYAFEHGPLLVLGAFGTMIALERAVALRHPAGFVAPVLGAAAAIGMLLHAPWAAWIATASALALVGLNAAIVKRQSAAFTWLMLLGSLLLVVGSALFALGKPVFEVAPSWSAFFVLTIVAERLELSRLSPTPRWAGHALVALCLLLAGLCLALGMGSVSAGAGLGVAFSLIAVWQMRFDIARRTVRQQGLPRYAAIGVLLGAAWLFVSGVLIAAKGMPKAGPLYDAALHGVFVGYVLSMVFAHATIIVPAVVRLNARFSRALYAPLAVLHLGLAARVAGDVGASDALRHAGSVANAVALGLFVLLLGNWGRGKGSTRSTRRPSGGS